MRRVISFMSTPSERKGRHCSERTSDRRAIGGDPGPWRPVRVALRPFWLEALLVVGVAVAWLWSRWGVGKTWLIGGPVVFAILWLLSNEVLRLLPNVY